MTYVQRQFIEKKDNSLKQKLTDSQIRLLQLFSKYSGISQTSSIVRSQYEIEFEIEFKIDNSVLQRRILTLESHGLVFLKNGKIFISRAGENYLGRM